MTGITNWRAWLAFADDVIAASLAWASMYWLRLSLTRPPYRSDMLRTLAFLCRCRRRSSSPSASIAACGGSRASSTCKRIVLAAGLGALLIPLVLVMLRLQAVVPRSVLVLYPIVLIFLMAGSRFAYRIWKEHRLYSPLAALGEPVLIVGAGEAGARLTEGARAQPAVARGRAARRRSGEAGPAAARRARAGSDLRASAWGEKIRRAQGDHRAAVGESRRAPARRGALRERPASKR